DAGEKGRFVEEAVVDGDVEAAAGLRVEETVEAGGFHGWEAGEWRRRPSRLRARRSLREKGWSLTKSLKAFHGAKRRAAGLAHLSEWATRMRRVARRSASDLTAASAVSVVLAPVAGSRPEAPMTAASKRRFSIQCWESAPVRARLSGRTSPPMETSVARASPARASRVTELV